MLYEINLSNISKDEYISKGINNKKIFKFNILFIIYLLYLIS